MRDVPDMRTPSPNPKAFRASDDLSVEVAAVSNVCEMPDATELQESSSHWVQSRTRHLADLDQYEVHRSVNVARKDEVGPAIQMDDVYVTGLEQAAETQEQKNASQTVVIATGRASGYTFASAVTQKAPQTIRGMARTYPDVVAGRSDAEKVGPKSRS